jgi:hypothetical protein
MEFYNYLFNFVVLTCRLFNIDESHGLKHSMDVYYYSNIIYDSLVEENPDLKKYKEVIDIASILHDMCDKKYMSEHDGLERIRSNMYDFIEEDKLNVSLSIISKLSYSYIKKHGYPDMGLCQMAYDIVGEADRLASYDFERCIIYQMMRKNESYEKSFEDAITLFDNRIFKYIDEGLFKTDCGKKIAQQMHNDALTRISFLKRFVKKI